MAGHQNFNSWVIQPVDLKGRKVYEKSGFIEEYTHNLNFASSRKREGVHISESVNSCSPGFSHLRKEEKMENRTVTSETSSRRTVSMIETYSSVSSSYNTNSESLAVLGEDVTMKQLATARETFSDLETAYRKFKLELENVKEEHRNEV